MQFTDKEYTCTMCNEHFRIDSEVDAVQASQDFTEGIRCPACREVTDHKRGSGRDEGQSRIHYGPCSRCGSQTEYFALPGGSYTSQCPECGRAYSSSSY